MVGTQCFRVARISRGRTAEEGRKSKGSDEFAVGEWSKGEVLVVPLCVGHCVNWNRKAPSTRTTATIDNCVYGWLNHWSNDSFHRLGYKTRRSPFCRFTARPFLIIRATSLLGYVSMSKTAIVISNYTFVDTHRHVSTRHRHMQPSHVSRLVLFRLGPLLSPRPSRISSAGGVGPNMPRVFGTLTRPSVAETDLAQAPHTLLHHSRSSRQPRMPFHTHLSLSDLDRDRSPPPRPNSPPSTAMPIVSGRSSFTTALLFAFWSARARIPRSSCPT